MLHELENNEAVLLMYLAGELPEVDRVDLEQQLRTDAGLRASLESLRSLHDGIGGAFSAADELAFPAATESARQLTAMRRTSRAMVKHRLENVNHVGLADPMRRRNWLLNLPRWAYPVSTAAIVLIAFVAYWGFTAVDGTGGDSRIVSSQTMGETSDPTAMLPTPPSGTSPSPDEAVALTPAQMQQIEAAAEVLPATSQFPRAVDEFDRRLLVFSAGAYDVSTMFNPDADSNYIPASNPNP